MKTYTNEMIIEHIEKKQKNKKLLKWAILPFFILIIAFIGDVFIQKFVLRSNTIDFLGYKPLFVLTGSMEPGIKTGDMIIVKAIKQSSIKEGDVITYALGNTSETVTHRVIKVVQKDGKTMYQTKGDNNNAPDPDLVSYNMILGKVVKIVGGVGKRVSYLFTGTGLTALVLVVLVNYTFTSDKRMKVVAREEARRMNNFPKYKGKQEIAQ